MMGVSLFLMGAGTLGVPRRHWDIGFAGNAFAHEFPGAAWLMMALAGITGLVAIVGGGMYLLITVWSVFLGKTAALVLQLLVLQILLLLAAVVLYGQSVRWDGVVLLVTTMISATCGLAAVGTLYGGLAAGFKGRETLLPLLTLPAVAPVLIGATRAVEAALGTADAAVSDGWQWVSLLTVFAVAFGVGGALAFGPLIDE